MPRPSLPLGSYGKITAWRDGAGWIARAKFRDFDGVVRPVKRSGRTKVAAERALRAALVEREVPAKESEVMPGTTFGKVAELWLAEVERAVDADGFSGRRDMAGPSSLPVRSSQRRRHQQVSLGVVPVDGGDQVDRLRFGEGRA
ncbi:MAG: hypothetical protein M3R63_19240 [Actinomycetota bacterium]|nr:hypothetical protein [Actinomycetota bacterium]